MPIELDAAIASPIREHARILPRAMSCLLMGVASRVAIVPRSFSPAMASAATDMLLLNTRTRSMNGTNATANWLVWSWLRMRS